MTHIISNCVLLLVRVHGDSIHNNQKLHTSKVSTDRWVWQRVFALQ